MRSPFRTPPIAVSLQVPEELNHWLKTQAAARKMSRHKLIIELLETQRATTGGVAGLLDHVKETVGTALDQQRDEAKALREEVRILRSMVAQAYRGYLLHTKPVPAEEHLSQERETERRLARWEEAIRMDLQRSVNGHRMAEESVDEIARRTGRRDL
jgi:hypothetical protein